MSAQDKKAKAAEPDTDLTGGGNVDQIRDILFGAQMRQYEKRFAKLEESLLKECSDLRDEVRRRLDDLEGFAKQESDALSDQLKTEKEERAKATAEVAKEVASLAKDLDKKADRLDQKMAKGLKDLREKLLDQSRSLSDDIKAKSKELSATLDREVDELRSDKVDRAALAAIFTEMAMRVSDEFTLPGSDES